MFADKFQCSFPRVLDVTLPRSQPDPGNGCDGNMRLDQYVKRFKRPNDAKQILDNFMKSKLGNSRKVFTLEELLKAVKGPGNTINPKFFEYISSCYGVGLAMLNEIFDSLTGCGGFKGQRPDFVELLKKFKKQLPKFTPKAPAKTPKPPKGNGTDNLDDLFWQ
ncbi:MAG: hypothetical protein KBC71_01075 [Candidatus Pacebacteria bacterium]|nr:hypothetical protein [Candidatus Paceibacterota bacterium]